MAEKDPREASEPEPIEVEVSDVFDLHSFRPHEVSSVVREVLDAAYEKGLRKLRIIHGRGVGVQRRTVRTLLERDPRVTAFGDAPLEAGGWGATWVEMAPQPLQCPPMQAPMEAPASSVSPADRSGDPLDTPLTRALGIEVPLICGAMYPCSNPELVAAVSAAGGIGVLQPISLTYVHGHDFREGIRLLHRLSGGKPLGMNALIEASSKTYQERMKRWVDIALEEGVRFFVTSLGKPRWVVEAVHAAGGFVYHDVTERKWADKGAEAGVDGLIAVNRRAGGHAGDRSARELFDELADLGLPLVCAGGIGDETAFVEALAIGYAGVQMGTRFIATEECRAAEPYKQAIVDAGETDIVHTERITGVPVAVIRTPYVERLGLEAGPLARWMLRGRRRKHWMRTIYALRSLWQLKRASLDESGSKDYWQAGKSVAGIHRVEPAGDIVRRFAKAAREAPAKTRPASSVTA